MFSSCGGILDPLLVCRVWCASASCRPSRRGCISPKQSPRVPARATTRSRPWAAPHSPPLHPALGAGRALIGGARRAWTPGDCTGSTSRSPGFRSGFDPLSHLGSTSWTLVPLVTPARRSSGFASGSEGSVWSSEGCYRELGICSGALQEDGQNKGKAAMGMAGSCEQEGERSAPAMVLLSSPSRHFQNLVLGFVGIISRLSFLVGMRLGRRGGSHLDAGELPALHVRRAEGTGSLLTQPSPGGFKSNI